MERQRVVNGEWQVGQQRITNGDWRMVERQRMERQRIANSEWQIVDRRSPVTGFYQSLIPIPQSSFATCYSPLAARCRPAFTLTELLVAIAILSIMFTLLFIPMTQAFDNARRGRIMAELQNAADYALEIMVRELTQATDVLPQERIDTNGNPLNLWDDLNSGDDDTSNRIDFVVRAVKDDRLTPQNYQQAYTVITYYLRRTDPSHPFQYLDVGNFPANRRQIFRAHWQPQGTSGTVAPEPTNRDAQNRWIVSGAWIMPDLSQLQPFDPKQGGLLSHTALTPPDIDVADLRFTVERCPEIDERNRKPVAVIIEMTLRKPTPGAKAKGNNPNETDVPSLFVRRRVKVVLQNVP
jgi:prepilin-type N-terminal cleavage/methylation domain-containing protein